MTTPLDKERLAEIRVHWMSLGHKEWMEFFFEVEGLIEVKEAAEKLVKTESPWSAGYTEAIELREALQSLNRGEA